jgi:hypothetical protein
MALTRVEREKITDGMLKIQSARASLEEVDGSKIPKFEGLEECLEDADKNLKLALKQAPVEKTL